MLSDVSDLDVSRAHQNNIISKLPQPLPRIRFNPQLDPTETFLQGADVEHVFINVEAVIL